MRDDCFLPESGNQSLAWGLARLGGLLFSSEIKNELVQNSRETRAGRATQNSFARMSNGGGGNLRIVSVGVATVDLTSPCNQLTVGFA